MAQQALVVLVAGQDVDHAPEAGPATAARGADVPGDQAGGGADLRHDCFLTRTRKVPLVTLTFPPVSLRW